MAPLGFVSPAPRSGGDRPRDSGALGVRVGAASGGTARVSAGIAPVRFNPMAKTYAHRCAGSSPRDVMCVTLGGRAARWVGMHCAAWLCIGSSERHCQVRVTVRIGPIRAQHCTLTHTPNPHAPARTCLPSAYAPESPGNGPRTAANREQVS